MSETRTTSLAPAYVDVLSESDDLQAAVADNGAGCQGAVVLLHDEVYVAVSSTTAVNSSRNEQERYWGIQLFFRCGTDEEMMIL